MKKITKITLAVLAIGCVSGCTSKREEKYNREHQEAYDVLKSAFDKTKAYEGSYHRTNMWDYVGICWDEEITFDSSTGKAALGIYTAQNRIRYNNYFNAARNKWELANMFPGTRIKEINNSSKDMVVYLNDIYSHPSLILEEAGITYEEIGYLDEDYFISPSNIEKQHFVKFDSFEDSRDYYGELVSIYSTNFKFNNYFAVLSSGCEFSFKKYDDGSYSVEYCSTMRDYADIGGDENYDKEKSDYEFTFKNKYDINKDGLFTNCERNAKLKWNFFNKQTQKYDVDEESITNKEMFEYSPKESMFDDDFFGYEITNKYPTKSTKVTVYEDYDKSENIYADVKSAEGLVEPNGTINFDIVKNANLLESSFQEYFKADVSKLYLDPDCTQEFVETKMPVGELKLYYKSPIKDECTTYKNGYVLRDLRYADYKFFNQITADVDWYSYDVCIARRSATLALSESQIQYYSNPQIGCTGYVIFNHLDVDGKTFTLEQLSSGISWQINENTRANWILINTEPPISKAN